MNATDLELARQVYRVLAEAHAGLSREQLHQRLGTDERKARDAVALASEKAAPHLKVIGFDPEDQRYHLVDLVGAGPAEVARARRIILFLAAYFETTYQRYSALAEAFVRGTGEGLDPVKQPTLLEASTSPEQLLRVLTLAALPQRRASRELERAVAQAAEYLGLEVGTP
ncbi:MULTISPECIES: hypothetical protein [unclassified Meiothermus]|uniref:hypothetical protein n=1 Tax=unclassified Meiothermus TaxID=370471 RepID=UPI000D7C9DF9|nr:MULTISPECIES: hypothetical protein [unclassified Meiothermus]PZA07772.1 hypothetical protein DNA98_05550 [Meiothermus sp. Pnk-1]RYM38928.1 hypothetical protein EWH23_04145 [Meiothermus sp. PNK-Is4]